MPLSLMHIRTDPQACGFIAAVGQRSAVWRGLQPFVAMVVCRSALPDRQQPWLTRWASCRRAWSDQTVAYASSTTRIPDG